MADSNKRDGVFTGGTQTVTNPSPTAIKGHKGPDDQPASTQYGKLPGRGRLA
jgi:hypothetical protein